jgi:predicted aminopeptidase
LTTRPRKRLLAAAVVAVALAGGLVGCGSTAYLAQSVRGHLALMNAARPVSDWVDDPATPPALRERLLLTQRIRDFAVSDLKLPDNDSYRRYADLKRPAAVWNVVAAPELSLKLKTACFPVVGCVGYRGYFDRATAEQEAAALKAQGYEVGVYAVPAYSTLGWSNWFGGDPLLNTFIGYPEGELARMVFHELAHQVAYAAGDTMFNESFATTVETLGGARWLTRHASAAAQDEYARYDGRRQQFRVLTQRTRDALDVLYRSGRSDDDKRAAKAKLMQQMRDDYAELKQSWGGYSGYDAWFAKANNASFGVMSAYNELVPQFEGLLAREGGDFSRFYAEVQRLAKLPKAEREAALQAGAVTSTALPSENR